jgi:hypothetical protein
MPMLEIFIAALPVFERKVPRPALVEPSPTWPKLRLAGLKLALGPEP